MFGRRHPQCMSVTFNSEMLKVHSHTMFGKHGKHDYLNYWTMLRWRIVDTIGYTISCCVNSQEPKSNIARHRLVIIIISNMVRSLFIVHRPFFSVWIWIFFGFIFILSSVQVCKADGQKGIAIHITETKILFTSYVCAKFAHVSRDGFVWIFDSNIFSATN